MKVLIYLFSFVLLSAMTFKNTVSPGDPIPGMDVKGGRRPPGDGQIFATGVTDANGNFEFKNIPEGTSYYVEIGKIKINEADLAKQRSTEKLHIESIKKGGDKIQAVSSDSSEPFTIDGIVRATGTGANRAPQVVTKIVGKVKATVTYQGTSLRVKLVQN